MNEQEHLTTSDLAGRRPAPEAGPAEPSAGQAEVPPGREEGSTSSPASGAESRADDEGQAQEGTSPLFDHSDRDGFQERWRSIQTGFVDQPRQSVEQADALVAEAMSMLAETFARERQALERQWGEGADVSTEDLRVALQRYRSFFERLLTA
jgi:hypothetical protein